MRIAQTQFTRAHRRTGFKAYRRASAFYHLSMAAAYRGSRDWKACAQGVRGNLLAARAIDQAWRDSGGYLP